MNNTMNADLENRKQLFHRVAEVIARADALYDIRADIDSTEAKFYEMMVNSEFIPAVEILNNTGKQNGMLSSGFAVPVGDGIDQIFDGVKTVAAICQKGGCAGLNLSKLQAAGIINDYTEQMASGPVKYMDVFNTALETVLNDEADDPQLMCILRIDHPDIIEFIERKTSGSELKNIRTVAGITEKFVLAARNDMDYNLTDPVSGRVAATVNARTVMDKIIESVKLCGQPGLMFMDRVNRSNPVTIQGEVEIVCPYGNIAMLPYETCFAGTINMTKMLTEVDGKNVIDISKLEDTVNAAVHFLDNVIDTSCYPSDDFAVTTKLTRKISIGVTGWAEMLIMMGIPYSSDQAVAIGERIMAMVAEFGRDASENLARLRGTFPLFQDSGAFEDMEQRHAALTSIFPSEEVSVLCECTSGIEPVESFVERCSFEGDDYFDIHPLLESALKKANILSEDTLNKIIDAGSVNKVESLPEDIRRVFVSATDVTVEHQIRMQEAFQKNTDGNVLKELKISGNADEIENLIALSLDLDCKSISFKMSGVEGEDMVMEAEDGAAPEKLQEAATEAVKTTSEDLEEAEADTVAEENPDQAMQLSNQNNEMIDRDSAIPRNRPDTVTGLTEKITVGCGNLYVTVNSDSEGICEIFTNSCKNCGCSSYSEAVARLASVALRSGIGVSIIIEQLKGIRCKSTCGGAGAMCTSCPDAIAQVLEHAYEKNTQKEDQR